MKESSKFPRYFVVSERVKISINFMKVKFPRYFIYNERMRILKSQFQYYSLHENGSWYLKLAGYRESLMDKNRSGFISTWINDKEHSREVTAEELALLL